MKMKNLLSVMMATLFVVGVYAKQMEPYKGSRIFWDESTEQKIFSSGGYARIIQLEDGRIMAAAESGGGISVCYSSNYGVTWTSPVRIVANESLIPLCVPDLIQLTDGTIIVGYNPRPREPYTEDRRFGIRCVRSEDNGVTWSEGIFIFDAQHTFDNGCWEPSFLELPSGELHCYFANENEYISTSEQCISVCRSYDKGLTWSEPDKVSFRAGTRDGMPVPILTENNEIVVIVEDNGWGLNGGFRATTVRCSLEDNWSDYVDYSSPNRNMIFEYEKDKEFMSAAPYLRQLWTGETIASWQGYSTNRTNLDMYVAIGDENARNFKAVTAPFKLSKGESLWNSVVCVGDSSVIALGSQGGVNMIKGYVKPYMSFNYGTPTIDGNLTDDGWYNKARQITLDFFTDNTVTADFMYDNENLYFYTKVIDDEISTDTINKEGVWLSIDTRNASDTYPQEGMFRFFLCADSTLQVKYGKDNKWHDAESVDGIDYKVITKSFYYNIEVAIPWKYMGYETAPVDNIMRVNIENMDRTETTYVSEYIPDAVTRQSWTWMEARFNEPAAVKQVKKESVEPQFNAVVSGRSLRINSDAPIASVMIYSYSGMLLNAAQDCDIYYETLLPQGHMGGIVVVRFEDGNVATKKMKF